MSHDPIVEEVRQIRDAIAQEHDYDLGSIFSMLRAREAESGTSHVEHPPRRPDPDLAKCEPAVQPGDAAVGGARRS
jgi:hypothetical protein